MNSASSKHFHKGLFCLFFAAILFNSRNVYAAVPSADTAIKKPYKLSEQQFLDKYGKDDSSRALIRYYFQIRRESGHTGLISAGISGTAGVLFDVLIMNTSGGSGLGALGEGILLMGLLWVFGIMALIFSIRWVKMSRKRLFKLIKNYNKGKGMPDRITTKPLFKEFLEEEKTKNKNPASSAGLQLISLRQTSLVIIDVKTLIVFFDSEIFFAL